MTLEILTAIDNLNPKSDTELLNIHFDWTNQDIFSTKKRTNCSLFKGLYLNANYNSARAMLNIKGLLKEYGIPLNKCYFLIKRHFSAVPEEVRTYIRNETIKSFSNFLLLKGHIKSEIKTIISNFEFINKRLSNVSPAYNDFLCLKNIIILQCIKKQCWIIFQTLIILKFVRFIKIQKMFRLFTRFL